MKILTREQHCRLAGIDIETFKSMRKRRQLPTVDYTKAPDGERGYPPGSTLILMIALDLHHCCGLTREAAAITASSGFAALVGTKWPGVAKSSQSLVDGRSVQNPIMCGLVEKTPHLAVNDRRYSLSPKDQDRVVVFCGTIKDLADLGPIGRMICVNVSEVAARMRLTANEANIDLEDFWRGG